MQQIGELNSSVTNTSSAVRTSTAAGQPHYTVDQVAKMWSMSRDSIRRLFIGEEGVLKIFRPGSRYKRSYTTLRIPETVLNRVYRRMGGLAA